MEITLETIKTLYPDIYNKIDSEAFARGFAQGKQEGTDAGMKTGAEKERERIKAVEAQALPGHEDLIAALKFDGTTTGEQAAVKVLAAEKALITVKKDVYLTEHNKFVETVEAADDEAKQEAAKTVQKGPLTEEQMKANWDKDANLRGEFGGSFEAYKAYTAAVAAGVVKIYGEKKGGK